MADSTATMALVENILSTVSAELDSAVDEWAVLATVVRDLRRILSSSSPSALPSSSASSAADTRTIHTRLRMLLTLARQRVAETPFHLVTASTLRLYTDASVLLAVLHLLQSCHEPPGPAQGRGVGDGTSRGGRGAMGWRPVVRLLDRAIIVAGAVGPQRLEWVHSLIDALQPARQGGNGKRVAGLKRRRSSSDNGPGLRPAPSPDEPHAPSSPPSTAISAPPVAPAAPHPPNASPSFTPLFAPAPIPSREHDPPPLPGDTPFILRKYLTSGTSHPPWPAVERWKSAEYLLSVTGRGRVVPVEVGRAYDESGWTQRIVAWESFLRRAGWCVPADEGAGASGPGVERPRDGGNGRGGAGHDPGAAEDEADEHDEGEDDSGTAQLESDVPLYLAQTSLFTQFPALERDIAMPDYVWSDPPAGYDPPPEVFINVWVGPGGHEVVSPAHTDPYFNCYAQVLGCKRVWLAPPDSSAHMYAYSNAAASSSGPGDADTDTSPLAGEYMTNTSRVPLLRPREGAFTDLQPSFPAFFEHVYPRAMEAVLEPGDLLVMPPKWWHAMRGEGHEPCWSVSFWF